MTRAVSLHTLEDKLAQLGWQVRQLVHPIHVATQRRITTHPALLDQLRDAAIPGTLPRGPERRPHPRSRPPLRLDAVDTLSDVYVGISDWHQRLNLPTPPANVDWHKATLAALADVAPGLAPSIADWLCADLAGWWHDAAVASGWHPNDLRKIR